MIDSRMDSAPRRGRRVVTVSSRLRTRHSQIFCLVRHSADHARRFVVFSYPLRHPLSRLFVAAANLVTRAFREKFRAFVHPPSAMLAVLEERRFRRVLTHRALVWQIAGFERE